MEAYGYEAFKKEMKDVLQSAFGNSWKVEMHRVRKPNIGEREAFIISKGEVGEVAPNFYVSDLYEKHRKGSGLEELAASVREKRTAFGSLRIPSHLERMESFESMRGRIVFRMLNREKNRELMEESPHIELLDLAMVFYIVVSRFGRGMQSVRVTNRLKDIWGVSLEDIREVALKNTVRIFPEKADTLQGFICSVISGMVFDGDDSSNSMDGMMEEVLMPGMGTEDEMKVMMLTNENGINGFGAILYPGVLERIADEMGGDRDSRLAEGRKEGILCG